MSMDEDLVFVGKLLDKFAIHYYRMGVAASDPDGRGVPPEMQVGTVNDDGWVEWKVLPSTLTESDVSAVEDEFGIRLPPVFRAYLRARFQMFDQVCSGRYDQQIFMTDTPASRPLEPLRELLNAWKPLIPAGYISFAQWGDGWGPMCFDSLNRNADGDCPVVWMDHELFIPLGAEACGNRESVMPLVQPLYSSCREFLIDVF